MKITAISQAVRAPNRVNVFVDGTYSFSLDVVQVIDLSIKIGREISSTELSLFMQEGVYSKLYARTLEYCLSRPHSEKEVRDYLYKKTFAKKIRKQNKHDNTYEFIEIPGASQEITQRVLERLVQKGYVNDEQFSRWWVETRHRVAGTSLRKLRYELAQKGVVDRVIEQAIAASRRTNEDEIRKLITKKSARYGNDTQKLMQYLARQGFSYEDIRTALAHQ